MSARGERLRSIYGGILRLQGSRMTTAGSAAPSRKPRADAERNRRRVLDEARLAFADRGAAASLEEIARSAGVGIGTLYRHFPTRHALVEAIYAEHIGEVEALAQAAADAEDAWAGLTAFLERMLELQARNLPLRAAFLQSANDAGG